MGRTVPSAMMTFQEVESQWRKFRRTLRKEDQHIFDTLFIKARKHISSLAYASMPFPIEGIFLAMLIEQQKELRSLHKDGVNKISSPTQK